MKNRLNLPDNFKAIAAADLSQADQPLTSTVDVEAACRKTMDECQAKGLPRHVVAKMLSRSLGGVESVKDMLSFMQEGLQKNIEAGVGVGLTPTVFIASRRPSDTEEKPEMLIIGIADEAGLWNTPDGQLEVMAKIAMKAAEMRLFPICVGLISEAWTCTGSQIEPGQMPSDSAKRREVAACFVNSKDRYCLMAEAEIFRDEQSTIVWLGDWSVKNNVESPLLAQFFNAFKDATPELPGLDAN